MNSDSHSPRPDGSEDILKIIRARRSVRDYLPNEVPDDLVREMIRAGCHAPSAMNKQPWRFVVIKDREIMKKLSEKAREMWMERDLSAPNPEITKLANMVSRDGFNIFYNAPLLIMVFSHPSAFSPQIDCALAAENMMIAARALGIGSCWIGLGSPLGQVASIMEDLGVPEGCKLMACLIFGYPVKLLESTPKRVENVILNWIK